MDALRYLLRRPAAEDSAAVREAFDRLLDRSAAQGGEIDYDLDAPRWQFLCHVADTRPVVLHGSGVPDIAVFEPRQSNDVNEFGNRKAVYAAGDGLWPMYFAILDRDRHPMSLHNACLRLEREGQPLSEPLYFFSISASALAQAPWRRGWVYLLPRDTFEPQAPERHGDWLVHLPQRASLVPVRPLARLAVGPEDFPFLAQIRGHDHETLRRRIAGNPAGFPWVDDDEPPATAATGKE